MSLDRFRSALVADEDPARAADRLADDLNAQGTGGSIGFVYVTDRLKTGLEPIIATLKQKTGVANWVGTIGFGVIGGGVAAYNEPAVAAMIAYWPEDQFKIFDREAPQAGAFANSEGMASAIVHVDPRHPFEEALRKLATTSGAYLFGGLTASRSKQFDQVAGDVTRAAFPAFCSVRALRLRSASRRAASRWVPCGTLRRCRKIWSHSSTARPRCKLCCRILR